MDDRTLSKFCQTNKYNKDLCEDKIIKDHLTNYKYCLSFNIKKVYILYKINR